jgi:hypothetical protein
LDTEREERIRERSAQRLEREREGLRRYRPGPGSSFYSPGMMATTGAASRLAATAAEDLDREIEAIVRALEEHGPIDDDELERLVGARYWGPGRFRAALREALEEGRVVRHARAVYGPAAGGGGSGPPPAVGRQSRGGATGA